MLVSLLFLSLLLILNYMVLNSSESTFVSVVERIEYQSVVNRQGEIVLRPERLNVLRFQPDGSERPQPLQDLFREDFQKSLVQVGIIGVIASFFIGASVTYLLTSPLNKLKHGLVKLRENNYKIKLEETGTEEIDVAFAEFNKLTQELDRVEQLRKDLISDTSHELKTPLTSLQGQIEALRDGVLKPNKKRYSTLLEQVNRLHELISRMQEFTRLRNKDVVVQKESIKLKTLVDKTAEEFKDQLKEKKINLKNKVKEEIVLEGDTRLVSRLFENLFSNAIQYSNALQITVSANEEKIIFQDNGGGVPSESLKYLFERFYRVEKSRNRKTGGMGLGLSIVKEICDTHGWKIVVENKKKSGLKFTIDLSDQQVR